MHKSKLIVAVIALGLCFPLAAARADKDATCTLVMPSGIDPSRLTFTLPGFLYTNADGTNAGDGLGAPITGSLLLPPASQGAGGLELHGAVLNYYDETYEYFEPIVEFHLFTDYTGSMDMLSQNNDLTYTPWGVQPFNVLPAGYTQGFRFFAQPGSAMMNVGAFYGFLSASLPTTGDPTGFGGAHFGIQGFTTLQAVETPEPGTVALWGGLGLTASLVARKRRRK